MVGLRCLGRAICHPIFRIVDGSNKLLVSESVEKIGERHAEVVALGFQRRHPLPEIDRQLFVVLIEFLESAALALHEIEPLEYICKALIAPAGRDAANVRILLYFALSRHPTRRGDFDTVIEDIDMNFTPGFEIVAVDETVDQHLLHGAFRVFAEVYPVGRPLVACAMPYGNGGAQSPLRT